MAQGGVSRKQYDHLIKLIIIGDSSVGKSCILLRFSEDHFPTSHMPTIGKYQHKEEFWSLLHHDCQEFPISIRWFTYLIYRN